MSIQSRKEEHVNLALSGKATFREKTNGFDRYELVYNALPELDLADVETRTTFCGVELASPFLVTGMTGGYPNAENINRSIAEACAECGIAMGVGSMRAALEQSGPDPTFTVVRQFSDRVPIVANIGAAQAALWHRAGTLDNIVQRAISMIGARALAVHLNPLQELLQPEGEPRFRGVLAAIAELIRSNEVPIIVKEVGAGISADVARRLADVGVTMIDVAGAGGTSWAGIEILRRQDAEMVDHLWDVGIPTAECVLQCSGIVPTIIASGGITNGTDATKALAAGAHIVGTARPVLEAYARGGTEAIVQFIREWELHLRQWMFLTGSESISALQRPSTIRQLS
ncbi:MAG: type 2 isopentenyl-diphosphate Delta-isomerase [Candidatus Kapabacteria bacterium]|nr:type 2 isopentenyl-diphosphate Delta-isomerase [Candidatus Kapabacteria bacterium]